MKIFYIKIIIVDFILDKDKQLCHMLLLASVFFHINRSGIVHKSNVLHAICGFQTYM